MPRILTIAQMVTCLKKEHHKNQDENTQAATQEGPKQPLMTSEELWVQENFGKKGRTYGFWH